MNTIKLLFISGKNEFNLFFKLALEHKYLWSGPPYPHIQPGAYWAFFTNYIYITLIHHVYNMKKNR